MLRLCIVGLALCSSVVLAQDAGAPPKYVGKKIRLVEQGAEVANVLQLISDVSKVNVVLFDAPPTPKLDIKAEDWPWDQLLDDVVARSGLSMRREGSFVFVGTEARLKARPAANYSGKRFTFHFQQADVRDAVELAARAGGLESGATDGKKPISVKLRNVPADQAIALLVELADAKAVPMKYPALNGIAAPNTPLAKLKLVGTATGTENPLGLIVDEAGHGSIATWRGRIASENVYVKSLQSDVLITNGSHDLSLHKGALAHEGPKTEMVAIDALLTEMDTPGALSGMGLSEAVAHKKTVLQFLRNVAGFKQVEESLPRDAVQRFTVVSYELGNKLDEAIAKGLHAKPAVLKPFLAEPLSIEGSQLFECWLLLEGGDQLRAPQAVKELVHRFEQQTWEMLSLASEGLAVPLKKLPEAAPPGVKYLPQAVARLGKLGVSPKEIAGLEKRARALQADYAGK